MRPSNTTLVEFSSGTRFHIREEKGGDMDVIREIYLDDAYQIAKMAYNGFNPALIIDVGAHIGAFSKKCYETWPNAKIIAIEPSRRSNELLMANVSKALCFRRAIGKSSDELLLIDAYQSTGSGFTTSKDRLEYKIAEKRLIDGYTYGTQAEVIPSHLVCSLEDILGSCPIPDNQPIDLLKLDCEGAEFEIFETISPETAARVKRIVGEFHCVEGYDYFLERAQRAFPHLNFDTNVFPTAKIGLFWTEEVRS